IIQLDSTYTVFVFQDFRHNVIRVKDCDYLEIYGFEIVAGRSGLETEGTNSRCIFRDLHIHHVGNVGVRIANGDNSYMQCVGLHIHDTYQHGEGFYIGESDGSADIHHCLFEGNYVHHTSLLHNQGDGIELKKNCWANVVRHNVFHDNHYPGILAWGTGKKDPELNNVIYGNLVFNSGDNAIQIGSECDLFSNLVFFTSGNMYCGLQVNQNQTSGTVMNNVRVYGNTIFGCPRGVRLSHWQGKPGMVFANNAVYARRQTTQALYTGESDLSGAVIEGNFYYGSVQGAGLTALIDNGLIPGSPPEEVFLAPGDEVGSIDLYPLANSELVDAASGDWVAAEDFNSTARPVGVAADVGAYEWSSNTNPGWQPGESPMAGTCPRGAGEVDFNGDGKLEINDVIALLLLARSDPYNPLLDWNGDGKYAIDDVIALMRGILDAGGREGLLAGAHLKRSSLLSDPFMAGISFAAGPADPLRAGDTYVRFQVPENAGRGITLTVFDTSGRKVRTLLDGDLPAGTHTVTWDGLDGSGARVSPGFYFIRVDTESGARARKVVYSK
ncbi:MAG: right-handed parallel beta-helix repeat-containing protein, partial [Gemmatimonadota bacterium]|nr:right-handed parallel beta-helix repeat-containing protein [Gemmatimonadota bacterium]